MKIETTNVCMKPLFRTVLRTLVLPASLVLLGGCAGQKMTLKGRVPSDTPHRIAVLPLRSSNPYVPGTTLADYLTIHILQNISGLEVVERRDLARVLQEQKLSLSGIVRREQFTSLGSVLGVHAILTGSVHTLETILTDQGTISVTVKLTAVATGRVLWASREKISHKSFRRREVTEVADRLMDRIAKRIIVKMDKALRPGMFVRHRGTDNFPVPREVRLLRDRK